MAFWRGTKFFILALFSFAILSPAWARMDLTPVPLRKLARQDVWLQKVLHFQDPKIEKSLRDQVQRLGLGGLRHKRFRGRIEAYIARVYKVDIAKVDLEDDDKPNAADDGKKILSQIPVHPSSPFFLGGSLSTAVSLGGEEDNKPASGVVGGKQAGGGVPNAVSATLSGGYIVSAKDQLSGLYSHNFQYGKTEPKGSGGGISFQPPLNIFGLSYAHTFTRAVSMQISSTYLDTTGVQDPTLSLGYDGNARFAEDNLLMWGAEFGASAPFSERSQKSTKQSTLSLRGNLRYLSGPWTTGSRLRYSYTFYRDPEVGSDDGAAGVADDTQIDDDYSEEIVEPELPSFSVNYLSREVARTLGSIDETYHINRKFSLRSAASVSYSYLNNTYSRWTTNMTVLALGWKSRQFSFEAAATVSSRTEDSENATFPSQWGGRLSLSYNFNILGTPFRRGGQEASAP